MNNEKLFEAIKKYEEYLKKDNINIGYLNDRKIRLKYYQNITKENLLAMQEIDFVEYIGKLWASSVYGNKKYLVDKIINDNNGFDNIKQLLTEFIFGKGNVESRWDIFLKKAKMFGPSYMSELLGYYYPDDFAIANGQVIKSLQYLGFKNMPHYNYQFSGEKYLEICDICKDIKRKLNSNNIASENLLAVDYFLWEIAKDSSNYIEESSSVSIEENVNNKNEAFIHNEIRDKIVEIGRLLGFEAKSEIKVGTGAVVDAIWSVNIGNMGGVIYAFEVQTKGSIDSLILNLKKANNNKSVQAVIAVSDKKQLMKIKQESEGVIEDLKLWNYNDVIKVYNALNIAMSEVNKLGLVPKEF